MIFDDNYDGDDDDVDYDDDYFEFIPLWVFAKEPCSLSPSVI